MEYFPIVVVCSLKIKILLLFETNFLQTLLSLFTTVERLSCIELSFWRNKVCLNCSPDPTFQC